jgi:hypothetical protein
MRVHDLDDAKHRLGSTHIASWPKRMKVFQPYAYIYTHQCLSSPSICMHAHQWNANNHSGRGRRRLQHAASCLPPCPENGCMPACICTHTATPTAQGPAQGHQRRRWSKACTARLCIELHACQQLLVGHRDLVSSRVAMACGLMWTAAAAGLFVANSGCIHYGPTIRGPSGPSGQLHAETTDHTS